MNTDKNITDSSAVKISEATTMPIIPVGGLRRADSMTDCIKKGLAAVSLCRPLICEPDFPEKIRNGISSKCTNCNLCTAYCDSAYSLRCHNPPKE